MNLSTRVLELEDGLHPMQILCARMTSTIICCFVYMWYQHVPSAPWGPREIRPLLAMRACTGFVGLYGMWYSIMYLPLAEATVIGFLAPNVAGYLCRIFLKEPFTRREQLASYLALFGVILITRPLSLFSSPPDAPAADVNAAVAAMNGTTTDHKGMDYIATTAERLSGIGMGLLGVVGGAITITVLRTIGTRAHPLISVNYFSMFCAFITILTLSMAPVLDYGQPSLRFVLPSGLRQWGLLTVVGLCGFGTQFLFTAGLAREKSNRATGMIYTHVLFAAGFDRLVFGNDMGWVSVAGCGMVVGSALWVAIGKGHSGGGRRDLVVGELEAIGAVGAGVTASGEDVPMLANVGDEGEGGDDVEMEGLILSSGVEMSR
jgi:drug/metabolite transporter (DMT)-like permease